MHIDQSPGAVESVRAAVERLPGARLEIDGARGSVGVRVGDRLVARIDLRRGGVLVHTPADTIPTLQRIFPSARATADGIAFDRGDWSEALAAIHRRAKVERLVPQLRVASP